MIKTVITTILLGSFAFGSDLTLTRAYKSALQYEAKIKSLDLQQKVKKIEIDMAESRLYPQVDASVNYQRRRYEYRGIDMDQNYRSYSLNINQMVYHPEVISQIESSELSYDLSGLNLTQQKQLLAFNIVDVYFQILKAQNSIKVAKAYLETSFARHEQIEKKFELRLANKMDYLESKVLSKQAVIKLQQERSTLRVLKLKLKSLTGIDTDIEKLPYVDFENIDLNVLKLADTTSLNESLELERAEKSFELSKKDIEISEFGHYPKIDLSASFSNLSSKEIINEYKDDRRVMLRLSIPLYKGGYTSAEIAKNRLLMDSAVEQMEDIKRTERVKYDELKVQYDLALDNIKLYSQSKLSAKAYLDSVNFGYTKGLKSLLDVEDAKKKFTETKYQLIESIYNLIRAYTGILNITGKMDMEHMKQLDNLLGI